jgi:UDP-glucose 4-epimerase
VSKVRIVVTGGAGYIGSVTVRLLCDRGHEVVVVDTLEKGHAEAVDPRASLLVGDVGDATLMGDALSGADAVMHLAGYIEVAESQELPERYLDNNVTRPVRMLDAMRAAGVCALAFSSTAAVYGHAETVPIPEDAPTRPVNNYGASKLAFEEELVRRASADGLVSIRLRYFNAAGAWPDGSLGEAHEPESHLIPRVVRALLGGQREFEVFGGDYETPDGTCVRDYIHVMDLAQAHALALERLGGGGAGGVFNLGNERGLSNLQVLRTCAEVTGIDVEPSIGARRPGDPAMLVASSERARADLGWSPERGELRDIVADAVRWHRTHPEGYGSPAP